MGKLTAFSQTFYLDLRGLFLREGRRGQKWQSERGREEEGTPRVGSHPMS